jgi:hypothetical protein
LNALYEVVGSGTDVWVNKRRFRIQRRLGEGGFAFVYLVREQPGEQPWEEPKDPSHISGAISLFPTLLFFCTLPNSSTKMAGGPGNVRRCSGHSEC